MEQIILMDKGKISRTMKRLAIQVWERLPSDLEICIIGLNERGYATARMLTDELTKLTELSIELCPYNVRDKGPSTPIPNCTEKFVLIVDDVIFSGKTMFSALSTICHSNEPQRIDVLTLIDRGHRSYPVLSELTGMEVPTKFGEHIEVILNDDRLDQVVLFKN